MQRNSILHAERSAAFFLGSRGTICAGGGNRTGYSTSLPNDTDELDTLLAACAGAGKGCHSNGNGNGRGPFLVSRDEFTSLEIVGRVRQAIGTLPQNYREAVILCELEEMSYEEAASALNCPVGTVRSRLHRARALLAEKLHDQQPMRRAPAVGE